MSVTWRHGACVCTDYNDIECCFQGTKMMTSITAVTVVVHCLLFGVANKLEGNREDRQFILISYAVGVWQTITGGGAVTIEQPMCFIPKRCVCILWTSLRYNLS